MPIRSQKKRIIAALGPTLALVGSALYFAGAIFFPLALYWYLKDKKPDRYVSARLYALRSSDLALSVPIYVLFISLGWMAIEQILKDLGIATTIAGRSGLFYLVVVVGIIYVFVLVVALIKAMAGNDFRFPFSLKIIERFQNIVMRSNNSPQPTQKPRG